MDELANLFSIIFGIAIFIAMIYGIIVLIFDGIGTVSNAFMEGLREPNISNNEFDVDESTMESQSEPQPVNDPEPGPQLKSKPNPRTNPTPNRSKRKRYWFESGEESYEYKSWHLDFLVDLDNKHGNLQKLCDEGGETLEAVMNFIKSDPVLFKTVKVIVMKYSESRYEKYFGPIRSKHRRSKRKDHEANSSVLDLNEGIAEIQRLKRMKNYADANHLALGLIARYPTEPLAYKSLSKVQALSGDLKGAIESMSMVLNLFQTDLVTAFVDVQYEQRFTPLFQHLFLEYINAAYYTKEFQSYQNKGLPQTIKSALMGESMPKITNSDIAKKQILEGIRLCNPFWERNPNEFKHVIEDLIESISLR